MTIYLVDGTFELFRYYYGAPPLKGRTGLEIGATVGFIRGMAAWLQSGEVTAMGIAFDTVIESFRNELFKGYKTGEGIEPKLFAQFPLVEKAAELLGLRVWRMIDFEADDALATAAHLFKKNDKIVIASPDKDLAQCVEGDQIVTWDRIRKTRLNEQAVIDKFGVSPASIPDWLALVGDTSDGIPGISGWGAKSASTVLGYYKTIERIPPDYRIWHVKVRGAERLSASLNADQKSADLYKVLATLRRDVPISETRKDLDLRQPDNSELSAFWQELGAPGPAPKI